MEKDNNIPETEEEVIKDKKEKKFSKHDKKLQAEIDELNLKIAELEDKYLRMAAEYDNYRRRSREEKDAIYENAMADTVQELLPIIDNLERAAGMSGDKVVEGVNMIFTQFKDTLARMGVEEIPAEVGGEFDPELHNAVMSANNPDLPSGSIAIVLQKGYKKGDKVFRYAMVSVNQ